MTKRAWVVLAVIGALLVLGAFLAFHYVPSPFSSVALRGDTIVATVRPNLRFLVFRRDARELEDISGTQSLEFRDGDSLRLQSAHTSYEVQCRTSPPPGLSIEGEWHLHNFPQSFVKRWFVEAR